MARRRKPRSPVQRVQGGFVLHLELEERELITRLLGEVRDLLMGPADQPLLRRMFPPAYHLADDGEAEAEYQRLMHDDLLASRLSAINGVTQVLVAPDAVLDDDALVGFMQAVNSLRLALGTLLDVGEDDDFTDLDDDDPLVGEHHLYGYLSFLLDSSVGAMSGR